jgi:DNA-binding NtrC family response regulator
VEDTDLMCDTKFVATHDAQTRPSVLIVEDDSVNGYLLKALLERSSFPVLRIDTVESLDHALTCLGESHHDLVLLDLNLPDSGGVETLTSVVRAHPHSAVVVITGDYDETLAMEILAQGAQDYLVKGQYSADTLVKAARYALGRKTAEHAVKRR